MRERVGRNKGEQLGKQEQKGGESTRPCKQATVRAMKKKTQRVSQANSKRTQGRKVKRNRKTEQKTEKTKQKARRERQLKLQAGFRYGAFRRTKAQQRGYNKDVVTGYVWMHTRWSIGAMSCGGLMACCAKSPHGAICFLTATWGSEDEREEGMVGRKRSVRGAARGKSRIANAENTR